jgi:SSS family solute:Na+ symporter
LTSAIYTEVLQFFMIVLGFSPVIYLGLRDVGGWDKLKTTLGLVSQNPAALDLSNKTFQPDAWTSVWKPLLAGPAHNPMGVDWFAMVFGLGFVLSFGYWCTNFLVVQRAMAAKNMSAARRTPLIAAIPKMLFPILVVSPGLIAAGLAFTAKDGFRLPPKIVNDSAYVLAIPAVKEAVAQKEDEPTAFKNISTAIGMRLNEAKVDAIVKDAASLDDKTIKDRLQDAVVENDYNGVILSLVKKYCPTGLLGLALTALLASFMSGMAGNVTAFNTIWTYDLYQAYLAPNKSDQHYFRMGQGITVVGVLLSIACAYFAKRYDNAMDVIQLVFSFVNAPVFATFVLAMFWKRTTGTGAFLGLLGGITTSTLVHGLTIAEGKGGWLGTALYTFPSSMAQNFWLAICAFVVCFVLTLGISLATSRTKSDEELKGLVYSLTPKLKDDEQNFLLRPAVLGTILIVGCIILNIIFW